MATLATWIAETRRHLMSGRQAERNVLQSNYTPGGGSLTLTNPLGGIVPGARLAIGLNVFYVAAVNNTGLQITVIGGQEGSTDAAATAGALVWVNPRFTDFEIVEALRADLGDLSAPDNGLFRVAVEDFSYEHAVHSYAFLNGEEVIDLIDVRVTDPDNSAEGWLVLPKWQWRLDRTAWGFANGLHLMAPVARTGWTLRVTYRTPFTFPADMTDSLDVTGLLSTAWDIPPIGAAARLMMPREVKRNFTEAQADSRRAAEVPPGAVLGSARALMAWRQQRIVAEAARLTAVYPDRVF